MADVSSCIAELCERHVEMTENSINYYYLLSFMNLPTCVHRHLYNIIPLVVYFQCEFSLPSHNVHVHVD